MQNANFSIQPCQSKFTFWKVMENKNFGEFIRFFPNRLAPPINLAQIQKQFDSRNCNSNYVSNLNFLPKGELFLISHFTSLLIFGVPVSLHNLQI
jgi:hypothetical protein